MSDGLVGANSSQETFIQKAQRFAMDQAELIHAKTGIPAKIVLIVLGVCVLSVIIGYFDQYITCLVGIVFPTICSIKALQTPDAEDDKQWLTYWIVYGLFSFIDLFAGSILKLIPFYFIVKIIFLIWLFLPTFRGAKIIYHSIIEKLFNKYRPQIDEVEQNIESKLNTISGKAQENISVGVNAANLVNEFSKK